ncbi:macro domain-containing protein [Sorangium sp. So ce363]|uniref:macro domain-containing protein n=1 Tax=Sorangium sp. So ce363 TaxID=3133304 RepID=UPI003F5DAB0F
MNAIDYRTGDATDPVGEGARIICHVCNDIGGWGRGFVVALSKKWPEPEAQYRAWHARGEAAGFRLGEIQIVSVKGDLSVANMIAQHGVRSQHGVPPIRYDALERCLAMLAEHARHVSASIHMPRIGCGLAGGEWPEVESIVQRTLCAAGLSVHVYDL